MSEIRVIVGNFPALKLPPWWAKRLYGGLPLYLSFTASAKVVTAKKRKTAYCRKICSFQKESVVCGRRIGIRKGSGDIVYDPRPEDPIVQFKLPGKQAREE